MSPKDPLDKDSDRDRRQFLEKAGRFAAVTPPTVALMLSATGSARAQATSGTTATTSTTVSTTATTTSSSTSTITLTTTVTTTTPQ